MLTEKQINEVREHLEKAQNPLFFFDNDNDGLVSFLLLQRFIGRGKGVAVKGSHNLSKGYFRRIKELNPDYIFVLDLPKVDEDFLEEVNKENLPVVWIDHHNVDKPKRMRILVIIILIIMIKQMNLFLIYVIRLLIKRKIFGWL